MRYFLAILCLVAHAPAFAQEAVEQHHTITYDAESGNITLDGFAGENAATPQPELDPLHAATNEAWSHLAQGDLQGAATAIAPLDPDTRQILGFIVFGLMIAGIVGCMLLAFYAIMMAFGLLMVLLKLVFYIIPILLLRAFGVRGPFDRWKNKKSWAEEVADHFKDLDGLETDIEEGSETAATTVRTFRVRYADGSAPTATDGQERAAPASKPAGKRSSPADLFRGKGTLDQIE